MRLDVERIRCIYCGSNALDVYKDETKCDNCGHVFPDFEGIKFLGSYNQNDTLGLLEITSKISPSNEPAQARKNIENSDDRLREAFKRVYIDKNNDISGKNTSIGSDDMAQLVRLREWGAFELLAKDFDFEGKLCLDNGAGQGTDSMRLVKRGAELVCLDYNPISVKNGSLIVPEAQWFAGNSEYLPFMSDTFDFTISNAALHHMNDLAGSLKEMIRVTKPGGYVLLISDPFMKNVKNRQEYELRELAVFDQHPMVLNGVNEGVIPFNYYTEFLEREDPKAKLLTMKIHGDSKKADTPTYWTLNSDDKAYLGSRSGNISSAIKVSSVNLPAPVKDSEEIPMKSFLRTIGDPRRSSHFLLPYFPSNCFDDFPFMKSSKFALMNGWHATQDFESSWRKGYNRVRLFFTKSYLSKVSEILVKREASSTIDDINMYISINGKRIKQFTQPVNKSQSIPITITDIYERNVIEVGIADKDENKGAIWSPYDSNKSFFLQIVGAS